MPGNDDDDRIIRHKALQQAEDAAKKPVTLKLWIVVAIAIVSFIAGALIF